LVPSFVVGPNRLLIHAQIERIERLDPGAGIDAPVRHDT
jgi:hypothetical protein